MVCPKLSDGTCKLAKKVCGQPYKIKMIEHKKCRVYKRGSTTKSTTKKR